jgi:hypothetical protein
MTSNLYFIANEGCDATTHGLVELTDEEFPRFKTFIDNLKQNSYYHCMPVIHVYKITSDRLREFEYNSDLDCWDDGYVDPGDVFYHNGKTYTFTKKNFSYYNELECVIHGRE